MDFSEYLQHLTFKGCSPKTIYDYERTYTRFFSRFDEVNEANIMAFLATCRPSTRGTYRIQLKSVASYYKLNVDFERKIPPVRVAKEAPITISSAHQRTLTRYLSEHYSNLFADLLRFMIETGLRISEVAALKADSVNMVRTDKGQSKFNLVIRKGNGGSSHSSRGRNVPLSDKAKEIIDRYGLPFVFERRRLNDALVKGRKALNLPHYKIHTARKTFMSRALKRGIDVIDLANMMGHRKTDTMLEYADASAETLANAFHSKSK